MKIDEHTIEAMPSANQNDLNSLRTAAPGTSREDALARGHRHNPRRMTNSNGFFTQPRATGHGGGCRQDPQATRLAR